VQQIAERRPVNDVLGLIIFPPHPGDIDIVAFVFPVVSVPVFQR
jgi:hypothetical protein